MITREDLRFATCFQLVELIASDWDNWSDVIKAAFHRLGHFDEPDGPIHGTGIKGLPGIPLKAYETEPEYITKQRKVAVLTVISVDLRLIISQSDGWQTADSDNFKKELRMRTQEYENELKRLITPEPASCEIKL